jgi:hypothetical protein
MELDGVPSHPPCPSPLFHGDDGPSQPSQQQSQHHDNPRLPQPPSAAATIGSANVQFFQTQQPPQHDVDVQVDPLLSLGVVDLELVKAAAAVLPVLSDPVESSSSRSANKSRQPHVLQDAQGRERTFGSALGLLTRQFMDVLMVRAQHGGGQTTRRCWPSILSLTPPPRPTYSA